MVQSSNFDKLLESVESLSTEEQEVLIDLVKRRLVDRRRTKIAENIARSQAEYRKGEVFRGTVDEVIAELDL